MSRLNLGKMNFIFILISASISLDSGVFGVGSDEVSVSVMMGDSVTLYTGVKTNQQEKIKWYFNDVRIAQINGDLSCICTDVQCNKGTERFRDRLKLDHQTGSLTIMNTRNTDFGVYKLKIINNNNNDWTFNVSVHDTVMDIIKTKSVKEGESVTFDSEIRKPNDVMTWYFNGILITEITGDQSKICTDVQCNERFRDRLKVNQTGSLTITHTRNTDSGEYTLQMISNRCRITKSFDVDFIGSHVETPVLNQPSGVTMKICVFICVSLLAVVVAAGIYCLRKYERKRLKFDRESCNLKTDTEIQRDDQEHLETKPEIHRLWKSSEATEME
ncbi:uncharacterized protein LOC130086897 [Rhinichthys klamathensis goyatoka]|uniref:uncharacterized protein LOC130086897 n=1 Tax=Rhinichthys klamathensis goyatoka TaxID=3034132 RepID=UPI0024B4C090|nr:uncharacterized protein LOC130086897 [Rhinichthys klamathensis goyatoka]